MDIFSNPSCRATAAISLFTRVADDEDIVKPKIRKAYEQMGIIGYYYR